MSDIPFFSPEVCDEIKYYVYRLVDPRNGETFYVGKGKNNRVFDHVKYALNEITNDGLFDTDGEDAESLKVKRIREIYNAGLSVTHIIQKYGLTDRDARIIESVLIDVYSIDNKLTNKIKGYNSYNEPTNAIVLQNTLALPEYKDEIENPKYIIIKIKEHTLQQRNNDLYQTTRSAWKINPEKAIKYPYVLSVMNGVVKEVYLVHSWQKLEGTERFEFKGEVAENKVREIFINKKIPASYRVRGQASPYLYSKV
jgi:hypothetical protein